jgi:hypothetical protein
MDILKTILFLFISIFYFPVLYSQCQGFHKSSRCVVSEAKEFKQYGQARSATVEVGKLYKFQVILYERKDYIVSVCAEMGFKSIHFKIIDIAKNELIYDNEGDDYNRYIGFSMEKTTKVNIEVEILDEDAERTKDPQKYRVCLGMQICWRKIPKMGFE